MSPAVPRQKGDADAVQFADRDRVRRFPKGCIDINMLDIRQSFDIFQCRFRR